MCVVSCPEPDELVCLGDHVLPYLDGGHQARNGSHSVRGRCPACRRGADSLTISPGDRGQRLVWKCHSGCGPGEVRAALIQAGVHPECLGGWLSRDRPATAQPREPAGDDRAAAIEKVISSTRPGPVQALWVGAVLWHGGQMPRGAALLDLAARVGVSRSTAYEVAASISRNGVTPGGAPGVTASVTASPGAGRGPLQSVQPRNASTSGFGVTVTGEAPYSVSAHPPPAARTCDGCGGPLGERRSDARYCKAACRVKAARARRARASDQGKRGEGVGPRAAPGAKPQVSAVGEVEPQVSVPAPRAAGGWPVGGAGGGPGAGLAGVRGVRGDRGSPARVPGAPAEPARPGACYGSVQQPDCRYG